MEFNWKELIHEISKLYISGMTEAQISSELAGVTLIDSGKIERVETDSTIALPFIQVNMKAVEIPHRNKLVVGNFLALNFAQLDKRNIAEYKKGMPISFKTSIIESNGPFPGVGISEFDNEKEILIMLGTQESEIA
jgi:hypothetical protein